MDEASSVLKKVSKQSNWYSLFELWIYRWRNLKNMFPGSELSQIKDINEKIRNTTQLINFSINAQNSFKRKRKLKEAFESSKEEVEKEEKKKSIINQRRPKLAEKDEPAQGTLVMNTFALNMIKDTIQMPVQQDHSDEDSTAFSLTFIGLKDLKKWAKHPEKRVDKIYVTWKQKKFEMGRAYFERFPSDIQNFISKYHFVIYSSREKKVI